ncbi:MAG: PAS domain S-box protein [Verrucomicrobia bacterium]|nr:PAS domain S-box protein [Verrucomicrobiota bacterium]
MKPSDNIDMDRDSGRSGVEAPAGAPAMDDAPETGSLLRIQRDLAVDLVGCDDNPRCFELLLESALRLPGFDGGGVFGMGAASGGVRLVSGRRLSGGLAATMERCGGWANHGDGSGGTVYHVSAADCRSGLGDAMRTDGISGLTVSPLAVGNQVLAFLAMFTRGQRVPSPDAILALEGLVAFARSAMAAIHARRTRTELGVELQLALDGAGLGTWKIDLNTREVDLSTSAARLHGASAGGVFVLDAAMRFVRHSDRSGLRAGIRIAIATRSGFSLEYRSGRGERWIASEARYYADPSPRLIGVSRDVTGRKRMEMELLDMDAHLRNLVCLRTRELERANADIEARSAALRLALEGSGAGGWHLDVPSGEVRLDAACRTMYGFGQNEELSLGKMAGCFHPESRDRLMGRLSEMLEPGAETEWDEELRIVHPVFGERWLSGRGRVLRDDAGRAVGMAGINIDVSERKKAETLFQQWNEELERSVDECTRKLRESESRFRGLAEATFDGVVVSQDEVIIDVNSQAAEMFGYQPEEVIGRANLSFVAPESLDATAASLREQRVDAYEWIGVRKDGSRIPVESWARLVEWKGGVTRVAVIRDLTEERRAAAEIASRRAELERNRALALMGEIVAGIVHQIGQPLSAVGSNLAAAGAWPHNCARTCCNVPAVIGGAAAHVARMRDIVLRIRAAATLRPPKAESIRINQVVEDVLPLLRLEADTRRLVLETDLAPDLPEIAADPVQLAQVVIQLARIVFETFAPDSSARAVRIGTGLTSEGGIMLELSGEGQGLSESDRNRLDIREAAVGSSPPRIGLRLSEMILHAHHGRIETEESSVGGGLRFRILFPSVIPVSQYQGIIAVPPVT